MLFRQIKFLLKFIHFFHFDTKKGIFNDGTILLEDCRRDSLVILAVTIYVISFWLFFNPRLPHPNYFLTNYGKGVKMANVICHNLNNRYCQDIDRALTGHQLGGIGIGTYALIALTWRNPWMILLKSKDRYGHIPTV